MTKSKKPPEAEIIDTDQYPAMLGAEAAEAFLVELSLRDTSKRANGALETKRAQISHAVRGYIEVLEKAVKGNDLKTMIEQAHEIRGLAANAGLEAVGRLADGRNDIIGERACLEAAAFVIDEFFVERRRDSLHEGAADLPLGDQRV